MPFFNNQVKIQARLETRSMLNYFLLHDRYYLFTMIRKNETCLFYKINPGIKG